MAKITSMAVITCISLVLNGCIGGVVQYPKQTGLDLSRIGPKLGKDAFGQMNSPTKCSEAVKRWGEPNNQKTYGDKKVLEYSANGFKWTGVMPLVVLPVPLILPVGSNTVHLVCNQEDTIVGAYGSMIQYIGAYCGLISELPQWGCKIDKGNF